MSTKRVRDRSDHTGTQTVHDRDHDEYSPPNPVPCNATQHTIGRSGIERSGLSLGNLLDLAVELRGGSLVELDLACQIAAADGLQNAQSTKSINVCSVFGHLERDLDMRLGSQVVDLVGLNLVNDGDEVASVRQIAIHQLESCEIGRASCRERVL